MKTVDLMYYSKEHQAICVTKAEHDISSELQMEKRKKQYSKFLETPRKKG